jgi:hypothetical protein
MMQKEENYQTELDASKEMIRDYMGMLAKYGFELDETKLSHSDLTGDSIIFGFVIIKIGIKMTISYNPTLNNVRRHFVVSLEKKGEKERLYLDQYLENKKRHDLLASFLDRGRVLEMRVFWNVFFEVLDALFSSDLKGVIEGKKWIGTPFDWQGYK